MTDFEKFPHIIILVVILGVLSVFITKEQIEGFEPLVLLGFIIVGTFLTKTIMKILMRFFK